MTFRVDVEPSASLQLDELDLWWREHRPDSTASVLDEFEEVIDLLETQPGVGVPYERKGMRDVRWVRLRGTPYKVYYHHEAGGDVVSIVAVWSGQRGVGPPLGSR
jgi:plasmid stabilization system protein ParE